MNNEIDPQPQNLSGVVPNGYKKKKRTTKCYGQMQQSEITSGMIFMNRSYF